MRLNLCMTGIHRNGTRTAALDRFCGAEKRSRGPDADERIVTNPEQIF
jgi:hypothetical protein